MAKSEDVEDRDTLLVDDSTGENPTTPFDIHCCNDNKIAKDFIVMLYYREAIDSIGM